MSANFAPYVFNCKHGTPGRAIPAPHVVFIPLKFALPSRAGEVKNIRKNFHTAGISPGAKQPRLIEDRNIQRNFKPPPPLPTGFPPPKGCTRLSEFYDTGRKGRVKHFGIISSCESCAVEFGRNPKRGLRHANVYKQTPYLRVYNRQLSCPRFRGIAHSVRLTRQHRKFSDLYLLLPPLPLVARSRRIFPLREILSPIKNNFFFFVSIKIQTQRV